MKSCALIVEGRSRSRRPGGESSGVGATEFWGKEGRFRRSAGRGEEDDLATGSSDGSGEEGVRAELGRTTEFAVNEIGRAVLYVTVAEDGRIRREVGNGRRDPSSSGGG